MTNNTSNVGCGCGTFLNIITVIFVAGKVFGFIDWSWWVVFSPTLFVLVTVPLLFLITGIVVLIRKLLKE